MSPRLRQRGQRRKDREQTLEKCRGKKYYNRRENEITEGITTLI